MCRSARRGRTDFTWEGDVLNAPDYVSTLFDWVQHRLDDPTLFPRSPGRRADYEWSGCLPINALLSMI